MFGPDKRVVLVSVFVSFLMPAEIIMNVLEAIASVEGFDEEGVVVLGELAGSGFGEDGALVDGVGGGRRGFELVGG